MTFGGHGIFIWECFDALLSKHLIAPEASGKLVPSVNDALRQIGTGIE